METLQMEKTRWDVILPVLNDEKGLKDKSTPPGLSGFVAEDIHQEIRLKQPQNSDAEDKLKDAIELEEVETALRETVVLLLKDGATYRVGDDGRLVYLLPTPRLQSKLKHAITNRSRVEFIKYVWRDRIIPAGLVVFKLFIGLFLLISLLFLALALIALLAASKNRDSFGGGAAHHHRHGPFWCPLRLWYWGWPLPQAGGGGAAVAATGRAAVRRGDDEGMSFAEAVFSFIFGDGRGDSREEAQIGALGSFIQNNDGRRLKAIHFTPFLLDPPPLPSPSSSTPISGASLQAAAEATQLPDESFMARIVWLFRGRPSSTDDGRLEYEFPTKNKSKSSYVPKVDMFREKRLVFSLASPAQQKLAFGLGLVNLLALLTVWARLYRLDEEALQLTIKRGGLFAGNALTVVNWMFPLLLVYGIFYMAIPGVRLLYIREENKRIDASNDARELWRRRVQTVTSLV